MPLGQTIPGKKWPKWHGVDQNHDIRLGRFSKGVKTVTQKQGPSDTAVVIKVALLPLQRC